MTPHVDCRAYARAMRLLMIGDLEARAVLSMAGGRPMTSSALQRELALSPGGAAALAARLQNQALARLEPDPANPHTARMRLTEAAETELAVALSGPSSRRRRSRSHRS